MNNCAFQYVTVGDGFVQKTTIVCDETGISYERAKELWNKYYPECAKWIKEEGNTAEMVLWVNMNGPHSYKDYDQYISTDAQSDGVRIWEMQRKDFKQYN